MTNALDLAFANAAANAPKGAELHLENLDSIANPTIDELKPTLSEAQLAQLQLDSDKYWANRPTVVPVSPQNDPRDVAIIDADELRKGDWRAFESIASQIENLNSRMSSKLLHVISEIETIKNTITTAASMSSEPNLKHRSLHEWDDSSLLNELVERENDLMPFYYELLKRIGSPELQSLVMSSMQGKNASMVTLAQLCSALAPTPVHPQSQRIVEQTYPVTQGDYQSTIANTVAPQQQYFGQATEDYIRQTNSR